MKRTILIMLAGLNAFLLGLLALHLRPTVVTKATAALFVAGMGGFDATVDRPGA